MKKANKLTAKKLIIVILSVFLASAALLGLLVFLRNQVKKVAYEQEYNYINPDETKAEADAGITIDGVLDEKEYQDNNWLYLRNDNGNATVDIATTSYYGEKGMYFVYDVTESTPIYVNLSRASAMNSCIELYLALSDVTNMDSSEIFEIDLLPTGDMVFKQRNGKGAFMDVATSDDRMAYLGATTKGGEINTEECNGYCLEFFIPWDFLEFLGLDVKTLKTDYVFVNTAHITSYNYTGTAETDRYWYSFAQQLGGNGWGNVSLYYRFDENGVIGTVPVTLEKGEHCTLTGTKAVIPGMMTHVEIVPEKGHALNSILVNGEEYIKKVSYNEDGSISLDVRGVKEGLKISASAEPITDGNKTLNGTIKVHKVGGDSLKDVAASYMGPTGEKPITLDSKGNFTLTDLKQGYYTITVEKKGYEKVERGIYVNRNVDTEITLEYQMFEVESGRCWQLENVNDGVINKMGGFGSLVTTDTYKKFSVEANFKYYQDVADSLREQDRLEQRQGIRIKFSNDKYWHIDLLYQNDKYFIQYAKATTNSIFNFRDIYVLSEEEVAKFKSEDGIQLKVERDGCRAIIYLGGNLIAVEDLDKEYENLTAKVGFESWGPYTDVRSMEYKISSSVNAKVDDLLFGYHKAWDVTKQFEGVVSQPKGGNTVWLRFFEKLTNMDLNIKVLDNPKVDGEAPRTTIRFEFDNGETFLVSICESNRGVLQLQNLKSTTNKKDYASYYNFTADEQAQYQTEEGIDFRVVRNGTEILFFICGEYKTSFDLSEYIKADTKAIVSIQHQGDQGVPYVMPFTLSEKVEKVTITQKESEGKQHKTEKGTTVIVSAEEGYYIKTISLNGKDVSEGLSLDGMYVFTAEEENYIIKASVAKRIFETNYGWNLLEQNQGTVDGVTKGSVTLPNGGTTSSILNFIEKYDDIDLTWRIMDHPGSDAKNTVAPRTTIEFVFDEVIKGKNNTLAFSVSESNKGVVQIQNVSGLRDKQYTSYYNFDEAETKAYRTAEGIDLRIARKETKFYLFLDGEVKASFDMAEYIKADTKATVRISHNDDNGVEIEMPYTVTSKADIDKIYFGYHKAWDVTNQFNGSVTQPKGGNTVWLRFFDKIATMDLNLKVLDNPKVGGDAPRTSIRFEFDNEETFIVSICESNKGIVQLQNLKSTTNKKDYASYYNFSAEEQAQYQTEEGIDFRVVRNGTEIVFFIGGEYKTSVDLSEYIKADTPAIVSIQHLGDQGVPYVMPFKLSEEVDTVTVKTEANDGKKLVTDKTNYVVGQKVKVEAEDGYYINKITVNGKDDSANLKLHGAYEFTATEKEYTIKATVAKKVFGYAAVWNLLNQNQGTNDKGATVGWVSLPQGGEGGGGGWLYLEEKYADMDLTWKVKDHPGSDAANTEAPRTTFEFVFDNGENLILSVGESNRGVIQIQNLKSSINEKDYSSYYNFTSDEKAQYQTEEGIDVRFVRSDTKLFLFVGGKYKANINLSDFIEKDTKMTVRVRHNDDMGVEIKMPFAVNDTLKPVTITQKENDKGTLKATFAYNGTVVLEEDTLEKSKYYLSAIKVDDTEVPLDISGRVEFTTTEKELTIDGVYKKAVYEPREPWSLINQHQSTDDMGAKSGTVTLPNGGYGMLYLYRTSDSNGDKGYDYGDIDYTLTLGDCGGTDSVTPYTTFVFIFNTDKGEKTYRLRVEEVDGAVTIKNDNGSLVSGTKAYYTFSEAENLMYQGAGIDVRVLREGTKLSLYVNHEFKKSIYLPSPLENDDMARVRIERDGDVGVQVDIPYKLSFPKKESIVGKYLSILGDGISMSAGKPENSDNNSTTAVNNVTDIYGADIDQGIGSNWKKLYWGQSLINNDMKLLVNNSVSHGLLHANPHSSTYGGDASKLPSYLPGYQRAGELDADQGELSGTVPDIIYLYMGTEDYKQSTPTEFATKYRETLDTITSAYPEADVFCFTVMRYCEANYITGNTKTGMSDNAVNKMNTVNEGIKTVASEYENVTLVDISDIITAENFTTYFPEAVTRVAPRVEAHNEIARRLQKALDSQYEIKTTITVKASEYGTVTTNKTDCEFGDTVVLTKPDTSNMPENYYLAGVSVNGEECKFDSNGEYSFTASRVSYTVESIFRKKIFRDDAPWDLSKQNLGVNEEGATTGIVTLPSGGYGALWLYRSTATSYDYGDIDLTLTLKDYAEGTGTPVTQVDFILKTESTEEVLQLYVEEKNGVVQVGNKKHDSYPIGDNVFFELSGEEEARYKADGIKFRVLREGTKISLFVDDVFKTSIYLNYLVETDTKLPATIENDSMARVRIQRAGDVGAKVEIPYKLSFPQKESMEGKYVSILGDGISMSTGIPNNADGTSTAGNNSTTAKNNATDIYGNNINQGIGSDWMKLYWGQSLVTNDMNLLVNNSVSQGLLHANPHTSTYGNDASKLVHYVPGYQRAGELAADQGTLAGTTPNIIYIYMGTEDRKQSDPAGFEAKYKETLDTVTATYPNAEIFCFTTMAYFDGGGYRGIGYSSGTSAARMKTVNDAIKKLACQYEKVTLVDVADIITMDNYRTYFPEGVTRVAPRVEAHNEIARRLQKALESQFKAVSK